MDMTPRGRVTWQSTSDGENSLPRLTARRRCRSRRAQQPERMRRIGALIPLSANDPQAQTRNAAFLQGLRQLGWTVGHNVQIDYRWSAGNEDDTRKYAAELVALAP